MGNFEEVRNIDNFCTVLVKKDAERLEIGKKSRVTAHGGRKAPYDLSPTISSINGFMSEESEEPLVDVFDEGDHVRILVQCRCREQEVTFHPSADGITVCREEGSTEKRRDVCRKLKLRTEELQLENRLFIIAKCNNNNTLEAMIPKVRNEHNDPIRAKQ